MRELTQIEIDTISEVSKSLAKESKYSFSFHEGDDIEQEAFLIGWEAIDKYNGSIPLRNFLYIHINNRLKTFKRDNYIRYRDCPWCHNTDENCKLCIRWKKKITAKYNLLQSAELDESNYTINDAINNDELFHIVNKGLGTEQRKLLRKVMDGVSIPKEQKEQLYAVIKEILLKHDY